VRVGGAAAVPRLDEVLDRWPEIRFNIDVKADDVVAPAVAAIEAAGARDRVLLASFSDRRMRLARQLAGPRVATSLAQKETARLWLASRWGGRVRLPAGAVAAQVPPVFRRLRVVDRRFIASCHAHGLQVHVWTVDDPAEMEGFLEAGVDGIMTDRIDVLREVFLRRGLWTEAEGLDHP
jgi:glycerophosphoryl diester phosphodiesterase